MSLVLVTGAYLVPQAARAVFDARAGLVVAVGLVGGGLLLTLWGRSRTRALIVVAGTVAALPALVRSPALAPVARGTAAPVQLSGTVSAPPRRLPNGVSVPLGPGPSLFLPLDAPGPLPGTRLEATARFEAHGRRLRAPALDAVTHVTGPPWWSLSAGLERVRRGLRARLERGLAPDAARRLRTLLLGDRGLSRDERERLGRTGTLHLFAVSGLHLSVVLTLLRRGLGRSSRITIPALLLYAMLAGLRSPVSRALLMGLSDLLAERLGRRPRPVPHLLLVMSLLVALEPEALSRAGFLLSCSAYGGILLLARPVLEARRRDPLRPFEAAFSGSRVGERLGELALVSVAAFVASAPATLLLFQRIPWTAIPGSLALGPLIPPLFLLGLVLLLLPGWPPAVVAVEGLLALLESVVAFLDRLKPLIASRAAPAPFLLLLFLAALGFVAWRVRHPERARALRWWRLAALPLLLCVPMRPTEGIVLLPAGRGTAVLVVGATERVLIDTGPAAARIERQLLDRGVARIDHLLISHGDDDHVGGLERLVAEGLLDADHLVGARGTRWPRGHHGREAHRAETPEIGGLRLHVHWPPARGPLLSSNDDSLALSLEAGGVRLLFTGDLETRGLSRWLARGPLPPCDALTLPHHGARNDALVALLMEARPRLALTSARAGFPDADAALLTRWLGIPTAATWRHGAVDLRRR